MIWMKVMLSSLLSAIVRTLLPVLLSEAGRFWLDYMPIALKVVQAAEQQPKGERLDYARSHLMDELGKLGVQYKRRWLNSLIELAVEKMEQQAKGKPK